MIRSRKFLSVLLIVNLLIAEFLRICLAGGQSAGASFGRSVLDSLSVRHLVRAWCDPADIVGSFNFLQDLELVL